MKLFLLFLSSLFICSAHASEGVADSITESPQHYTFQLTTPKATLSGILIARCYDNEIICSMVNEFGISAIDFSFNRKKDSIKLLNVVSFLNKWYIKMVLRNDLKICVHKLYGIPLKKINGYCFQKNGDGLTIENQKRQLIYSFYPLNLDSENDTK